MLQLNNSEKQSLLKIARRSVEACFTDQIQHWTRNSDIAVRNEFGVFVSIHMDGELRGCMGRLQIDGTLAVATAECAVSAAFEDPRFVPISCNELNVVKFEVSVLSPLEPVNDIQTIEVGRHGLLIEKYGQRGLLLPQVATQYGWDRTEFLKETAIKAGLEPDAWQCGAALFRFQSIVFDEETV